MSLLLETINIINTKDMTSEQMEKLLTAEEKRKKLIERGILRKPERKVARAGEAHSKFLNYHN